MISAHKYLKRNDDRVIIHFDYDCFYASVFEAENPTLKSQPLAVQQKQIIVTCNYVARERGLRKLQLIKEAKQVCPDVVIVLGEDLTRFRNASKSLYRFIQAYSWNKKVERLGFDEVFVDVTDMIDYNVDVLNHNDLSHSFFQMSKADPTIGFSFDATRIAGHSYPPRTELDLGDLLTTRLILGSHLADHIRLALEEHKNFTATVGVSTNRVLSKFVGNLNKPHGLTTIFPPYASLTLEPSESNIINFMDTHDIGAVPWIGFKVAQKLRSLVLKRDPATFEGLVYGRTHENVTVQDVRTLPGLTPEVLDTTLNGPGMQRGIGKRVFQLLHGVDDVEVAHARDVPRQISIEDSYLRLDSFAEMKNQLTRLSHRLIERMRVDLIADEEEPAEQPQGQDHSAQSEPRQQEPRWLAHAQTLRLTTRPRLPIDPVTQTRPRTFKRISRSTTAPPYLHSLHADPGVLADRLVETTLLPLFKRLHPQREGLNLSLMNVAVTDFVEVAPAEESLAAASASTSTVGEGVSGASTRSVNGTGASAARTLGRDVRGMFARQEEVLRPFRVMDDDVNSTLPAPHESNVASVEHPLSGESLVLDATNDLEDAPWLDDDGDDDEFPHDYDEVQHVYEDATDHNLQAMDGDTTKVVQDEPTATTEEQNPRPPPDQGPDPDHSHHTRCPRCGFTMPLFAREAHARFHALGAVMEQEGADTG